MFDIEKLPTHGGSLRVFSCRPGAYAETPAVQALRDDETAQGLGRTEGYADFSDRVADITEGLRTFLNTARAEGKSVAGYGAAAKGNTFLNVAGIGADLIGFVVDRNPEKQGTLLPGSHIPVCDPSEIAARKPDYLVILPWNIRDEVMDQQAGIRDWGGQFVTAVPKLTIA